MNHHMQWQEAVEVFVGNPFAVDGDTRDAAADALGSKLAARGVREAVESGQHLDAERRLLAIGHAQACAGSAPAAVLGEDTVPRRVWEALPRGRREAFLPVLTAAGRAFGALSRIAGSSDATARVRAQTWAACFGSSLRHALVLDRVVRDHDVLIHGETGTGKEMIADVIQRGTPGGQDGAAAPRAAINVAAVPETLVESELFGHRKGAFTGATEDRIGLVRSAHGGSFFLDEVGDLKLQTQVKLLRVMETDEVTPLGRDGAERAQVRWVAATHKDLRAMVDEGEFRRDLYERLAGMVITLPPLRDRREDIPAIGRAFVESYLPSEALDEVRESVDAFLAEAARRPYAWPGNVRELQNALRSVLLGLPPHIDPDAPAVVGSPVGGLLPEELEGCSATLEDATRWYVQRVLTHSDGNVSQAARILGIDRATVRRRAGLAR